MSCTALVMKSSRQAAIEAVEVPELKPGYMKVRTTAVALNPADWKHIDFLPGLEGCRLGCDYAGIVEEVADDVTTFKKGDRVAGMWPGGDPLNKTRGAFATVITAKPHVAFVIPPNMSDTDAAALPVGIITAGQGLIQCLGLATPWAPLTEPEPLLIYGGSTTTGILGIQFARLSGYEVYTVASPRHEATLRSLGAAAVFDYSDADACVTALRAATKGRLTRVWDCISTEASVTICTRVMADEGGKLALLLGVKKEVVEAINPRVESTFTYTYTALGEDTYLGGVIPASEEDARFAEDWCKRVRNLLEKGSVKPAEVVVDINGTGLEGVLKGLDEFRQGRVSGKKLVCRIR